MSVFDDIIKLQKEIKELDKITIEQQIEFDNQIMEFQFNSINEVFESMRNDLSSKEIVDEVFEETTEPDTKLSSKELKDKYTIKELKNILKTGGIKGYSKLNEDELIDLIITNNLN